MSATQVSARPKSDGEADDGRAGLTYAEFLASKARGTPQLGRDVDPGALHPMLHDFQRELVIEAVARGRSAMWADTGLGKTIMQLEWARLSADRALVVAPLAVCKQTVREAAKLDIDARYVRSQNDVTGPGIWITNYEMTPHFDAREFDATVLDESSILKNYTAKTRDRLIAEFAPTPLRLACTATPAPNDTSELTNHAEYLSVTTRREMLATYFVHDQDGWRLKGHARRPMFRWMAEWATALRKPSDLGFSDEGYDLPGLNITPHLLPVDVVPEGQMFATDLGGVGGRAKVRRATMDARVARVAELVEAEPDEAWLLWCGLNDEAEALADLIPGAVNVTGSWTPEAKADALLGFADGEFKVLICKPSIAAQGMNFQRCARMTFVGLSDSYEAYYQAIRRCFRYGQDRVVEVHIVLSELEAQIADNVIRKEREAAQTTSDLIAEMQLARTP